jgi:hypothetical protein
MRVTINSKDLIIGAVYGPNDYDPNFFRELNDAILNLGNVPVILGGDFNCTYSADPVNVNIDCHGMVSLPNHRHSMLLAELCENVSLCDPFRFKFPSVKKFSYKPFGVLRKNRSRIDFFLISNNITVGNFDCTIGDSTLSTAFDHKPCFLNFSSEMNRKRGTKKLQISPSILRDVDLDIVAWYSVLETYLTHLSVEPDLRDDINQTLAICGNVRQILKNIGPDPGYYLDLSEECLMRRDEGVSEIRRLMREYPIELLYNFDLSVGDDIFLEVLLNNFRNDVTSYQAFINKFKFDIKNQLTSKIRYACETENWTEADLLEDKLTKLNEQILRDRLTNSNLFDILNNEKMTPMFLKLAKISTNQGSLSEIKDDNGVAFSDSEKREKYIFETYQKQYGTPPPRLLTWTT